MENNNNLNELNDIFWITENDVEQISKISTAYWSDEGEYPRKLLISIINEQLSFSIKIQNEIIAFCLMKRDGFNDGYIFLICVKDQYRHKGLGYKLINYCMNNAKKEQGIRNFFLHVSKCNEPAINLYKKFGFAIKKEYKNYYRSKKNPERNPAYMMFLKKKI